MYTFNQLKHSPRAFNTRGRADVFNLHLLRLTWWCRRSTASFALSSSARTSVSLRLHGTTHGRAPRRTTSLSQTKVKVKKRISGVACLSQTKKKSKKERAPSRGGRRRESPRSDEEEDEQSKTTPSLCVVPAHHTHSVIQRRRTGKGAARDRACPLGILGVLICPGCGSPARGSATRAPSPGPGRGPAASPACPKGRRTRRPLCVQFSSTEREFACTFSFVWICVTL